MKQIIIRNVLEPKEKADFFFGSFNKGTYCKGTLSHEWLLLFRKAEI